MGMAYGYYAVTGRPQAVMVHTTPGTANYGEPEGQQAGRLAALRGPAPRAARKSTANFRKGERNTHTQPSGEKYS